MKKNCYYCVKIWNIFIEFFFLIEFVRVVFCCRGLWDFCEIDGLEEYWIIVVSIGNDYVDVGGFFREFEGWKIRVYFFIFCSRFRIKRVIWSIEWGWNFKSCFRVRIFLFKDRVLDKNLEIKVKFML